MSLKILVVDDSQMTRRVVSTFVGSRWTVCGEAESGKAGLKQFRELKPDLVLLDLGMPDIDGLEVGRQMHAIDPSVPLVLFTLSDPWGLASPAPVSYTHLPGERLPAGGPDFREQLRLFDDQFTGHGYTGRRGLQLRSAREQPCAGGARRAEFCRGRVRNVRTRCLEGEIEFHGYSWAALFAFLSALGNQWLAGWAYG